MDSENLTKLWKTLLKFWYFRQEKRWNRIFVYSRWLHPFSLVLVPFYVIAKTASQWLKRTIGDLKEIHVIW